MWFWGFGKELEMEDGCQWGFFYPWSDAQDPMFRLE